MKHAVGVCALLALLTAGWTAQRDADARWRPLVHVPGALDVAGPRADGRLVVASSRGLFLFRPMGTLTAFAPGYVPPTGETYVTLAADRRLSSRGCRFHRDDLFALDPVSAPGVVRIDRAGRLSRFVEFPSRPFLSGIAFDRVGRFGSRLLVTAIVDGKTTLYAIDCRGRASAVVRGAPKVEGGIAVAPLSFGRFPGRLIAADEISGRIFAFDARGGVQLVAAPRIPAGGDIGVESVGFVPRGFGARGAAYLADLGAPGSPTSGTDSLLVMPGSQLVRAGVRPGDLIVATEAGALTLAVRCRRRCTARRIGQGPEQTHGEGHIAFAVTR